MGWRDYGYGYGYGGFRPYVSVAQRRASAAREMQKLEKKGRKVSPVKIDGRTIAKSFWGKGWCDHLESFSDFSNRLPRGRTYVRNGSVVDLQIQPGKISAMVMGSELYHIEITIERLKKNRWETLKQRCAGKIKSVLELLKGGISAGVMEVMSHREEGMFPAPKEIKKECSCPDYAGLCKHLAAVLYGVGARLDAQPELLFTLRQVDPAELIAQATESLGETPAGRAKALADDELSEVFGIDLVSQAEEIAVGTAGLPTAPPRSGKVRATPDASDNRSRTNTKSGKNRTKSAKTRLKPKEKKKKETGSEPSGQAV